MVSICMATRNGEKYITQQIDSIIAQLSPSDELIVSDDASTDQTLSMVRSYRDSRIRIIERKYSKGIPKNFETALQASRGEYIFLADQDDIWLEGKVATMCSHLRSADLVVSDAQLFDQSITSGQKSLFGINNAGPGLLKNVLKNSYVGCCMAFRRAVLDKAMPFPDDIPAHDFWIGMIGEIHFTTKFIPEVLVLHRRHLNNASTTGEKSRLSLIRKFDTRFRIIKNLIFHKVL